MIETDGLTKRFGRTVAVDGLSLAVEEGQVFGFLGPNGSGKTTTIGMLLGIVTPTAGRVRLFGLTGRRGLHEARQRVGATLDQAGTGSGGAGAMAPGAASGVASPAGASAHALSTPWLVGLTLLYAALLLAGAFVPVRRRDP